MMGSRYLLYADRVSARFTMRKEGEDAVSVFTSLHDAITHVCSLPHAEGGEMILHSPSGQALTRLPVKKPGRG
jgi:hypothetical protein